MASDKATIHHVLGLLERHSFKTLEHAVQQFKDHKQRFHESLLELKSLKPPTGGDLLNVFTHPISHGMQARCTLLKQATAGDFLNVSTHPSHGLQTRCTPLKPPSTSIFVHEGTENHGSSKQYALRPRATRKLITSALLQRITRSRAKQPATSTAAACNIPTKTDFMVLADDFVEVNTKTKQHQWASFQDEVPTEPTASGCGKNYLNQSPEHGGCLRTSSQDVIATTTAQKQPGFCKKELLTPLSIKSLTNPKKEGFSPGDAAMGFNSTEKNCPPSPHLAQQIPLSKTSNLVTPSRSIGKCNPHVHIEAPILGADVLAKSPYKLSPTLAEQAPIETNDAVPFSTKQEKQFPTNIEDGHCVAFPKEDRLLSLQLSPITVKHSPSSTSKKILLTNSRETVSRKRKLSTCGFVENDYHSARKRIINSRNSMSLEAFTFDDDVEDLKQLARLFRGSKKRLSVLDVHNKVRRSGSERVSTPGNMDSFKMKGFRIGTIETVLGGCARSVTSQGPCGTLPQAHYEVAQIGLDNSSQDLRCILKDIHEGKPACPNSFQVTNQEVHQSHENIETSFDSIKHTHVEESNCDNQLKTHEKQVILVPEFTLTGQPLVSEMDSSAVCLAARLQPEQEKEMGLSNESGLLLTSLQEREQCVHELADDKVTLLSGIPIHPAEAFATGNVTPQEKAVLNSKCDVFSSLKLKVIPQVGTSLSSGMRNSPVSNSVEQMESNFLLSSSKSIFKYHSVSDVAEFASVSISASEPMTSAGKEKASKDDALVGIVIDSYKEKAAADNVLVGTDLDSFKEKAVADNVLPDKDLDICTHDMKEKSFFPMGTEVGTGTNLGHTFELVMDQVISGCDFAARTPRQATSSTKAGSELKWEERAWIPVTNSSCLATENLDRCKSANQNVNEDALPAQALELESRNRERSSKSVSMGPNFTVHVISLIPSPPHEEVSVFKMTGMIPEMKQAVSCCREIKLEMPCSKSVSMEPNSTVHVISPIPSPPHEEVSASKMAGIMPEIKKTDSCCRQIKLEMPCSQDTECEPSERPDLYDYEGSTLKGVPLSAPSPSAPKNDLKVESSICIPDIKTKERTVDGDNGDAISNTGSQMDCSETPSSSFEHKDDENKFDQLHAEKEPTTECKLTSRVDEDILRFSQILAQGTVNSSRRKRARSPAIFLEESCKDSKKIKLSITGQSLDERLPPTCLLQSPFEKSSCPLYSFPHLFSPVRSFQDTFGMTFKDSPRGELHDSGGFDKRQMMDSNKLSKSYSGLSALRKEYLDTPHIRSARVDLVDRTSAKFKSQKSEWHLDTHIEEDGKENQTPEPWLRGKSYSSTSIVSEKQASANTRRVLGQANQSLGQVESSRKCYNLAVETRSFLDLVQQKQVPLPYPNGKREVRVKALEAAGLARRQEERRENERKMRRLECDEAYNTDLEGSKDKMMQNCASTMAGKGVTYKVKRVAELKMKMDHEKARKQEVEQRKKEEERKKKEAELADKKRKRDDADKKEREEKRKRVEEVQRLRKEQEERQRLELNEKEHKRKMLEERERERKAQEEEAKRQRRLEKEKEAERRRKQEQHLKAARFADKQAERKRKEAMLQARGCEDDHMAQLALGNKLSFISTESLAVSNSTDWEPQCKSILRASQTSEDRWGLRVPSLSTAAYCQTNNTKLSAAASFVENGPPFSTQQLVQEAGLKCGPFRSLRSQYTTPYAPAQLTHLESDIQSYEISPYKSSSDEDEDDDDRPKKPIPLWARTEFLLPHILWQQRMDPDDIFSSEKTCSLGEIFGTTGSRRCKNFSQRSASGDWLDDYATKKEELDYKKAMGYIQN